MWISVIGFVAAFFSMISFVPQALKVIRSKNTECLSASTYMLTVAAFALWTTYGIILLNWPLILTNSVCLIFSSFIMFMVTMRSEDNASSSNTNPLDHL
jgi:MtN3 and saliva related transmembrane protein